MPVAILVPAVVVACAIGVAVLPRRRRIGALLIAHGLSLGLLLGFEGSGGPGFGLILDQVLAGSWVLLFLWVVLIAYLLPDERPVTPFWARWVGAGLVGTVFFAIGAAGDDASFRGAHDGVDPPLAWLPAQFSSALGIAGLVLVVLLVFGAPVAVWARLRTATGDVREQLLWLVWGAIPIPVALVTGWVNHLLLDDGATGIFYVVLAVAATALPLAIGVAVLRHRLFDIHVVLSRTLTYTALTVLVLGVYGGLLVLADAAFGNRTIGGILGVVIVAVGVHPVEVWVRRRIERWVFGDRADLGVALRRLADRAEAAGEGELVEAVTRSVAEAVRADGARVGPEGTGIPLLHRGERLGDLALDLPPGRVLNTADEVLLRDLARYVAVIVRSEQQASELRESRSRLVTAREEERRRLRHDLHDGVGPSLAAIVLKLNAARARAAVERDALIVEAVDEVKEAVAEVRRLVDDLRPPAIDEVGLVQAIRQRASSLSGDIRYEVSGPLRLVPLPAAVEVAAFRIASEAMTNVARHSGATQCRVEIDVDRGLRVVVGDNGRGLVAGTPDGVGWTSMRERAAELGGSCTITVPAAGGLIVRAFLPLDLDDRREVST